MTRWRWTGLITAIAVVAAAGITSAALATTSRAVALPGSMAAVGDSVTRAFDVDQLHPLQERVEESWSTGTDPSLGSHYDRILAAHPALAGHAYNDALTGAKMVALDGQLTRAAAQQVDYVTVLMGANDLCTRSVATMTPTATFRAQFARALADFFAADPNGRVFVSSIPDLFRLWSTLRTNPIAEATWALAGICPSMLSLTAPPADRQQVVAQEQADNAALASVCRRYDNCRYDNGAVYQARFTGADVSPVDYFHPSLSGQKALAAVTWAAGYWPSTG